MNRILVHTCCAVCFAYPCVLLQELGYSPISFFSNSNIYPKEEYLKRLNTLKEYSLSQKNFLLLEDFYNHDEWLKNIEGLEQEQEKGKRCVKCIEFRLERTAKKASELNIKKFTTVLPVSPHKNFEMIKEIGEKIAQNYDLEFVPFNFKKKDGFKKTLQIANSNNFYKQNYCGCEFTQR